MPAPFLETPPNPADTPPAKLRSTRFGELEEHELVRLLDTLDDERAKARFRESIYISLFVYIIIGWFVVYGPRVIFHQPRLVSPFDVLKQREMTNLQVPRDIAKALQKNPKPIPKPQIDQKTLAAMRHATAAAKPLPAAPQPQAPPPPPVDTPLLPQPQVQRPPTPAPPTPAAIPDAPRPSPNFAQNKSAGSSIQDAIQSAAKNQGGADYGSTNAPSHSGVGMGAPEILSDTMGVNFNPYLQKIMRQIYNAWVPLIPEEARPPLNKQGTTQLRITIMPDGRLHIQDGANNGLVLEGSTHDEALNRAAWGSITGVGQFPPLPSEFHGPNLVLRIHYLVNMKPE